jgi:hypothetical protein
MRSLMILLSALSLGCIMAQDRGGPAGACDGSACLSYKVGTASADECLIRAAVSCNRTDLCSKIASGEAEFLCREARGGYDPGLCPAIQNLTVRDECYMKSAQRLNQSAICAGMGGAAGRDLCVASVAYRTRDRRLCNPVAHPDRRDFCFAVADRDARICGDLVDEVLRERCIDWTVRGKYGEAFSS